VITQTLTTYDPTKANSKPDRLMKLAAISELQRNALNTAYTTNAMDPRNPANASKGVVTQTSTSGASTVNMPNITSTTTVTDNPKPPGSANTQTVTNAYSQKPTNSSLNTDYAYRMPTAENDAQYQRGQISLLDEQYAQFMFTQNLKFLQTVFNNELNSIDLDIKRLQIAYLNTLLLSPIDGIVSGLFRDPGDCVKAGQAVLRVENEAQIYLVGTIICRSLLTLGSKMAVETKLFGDPAGSNLILTGSIVSIRGHDAKDDIWDVMILCNNQDRFNNNQPILPLNYNFDYDDTIFPFGV
jgi:HlyD family secretion protein